MPTAAELIDVRQKVARRPDVERRSMETLRLLAFEETLRGFADIDPNLAGEVTSFYLSERFAAPILFADARPMLMTLKTRFDLALVSNGNSDPETCGLPGVFRTTLFADQLGIAKPDPRIYEHLLNAMEFSAVEVVHIGDSLRNDVEAAASAGMRTVWLDRSGEEDSAISIRPDATIRTLLELPAVLESWT